jgi:NAD(P)-dependent dehydrogenase (short-subunit alcohol dehydrogenase family)
MSDKLNNKIALVTGGTSGIGLATAKRFLQEGAAHVYITGRRPEELDKAVKALGKNVTGVRGDVSKKADIEALYEQIKKAHGKLDIVFANAGGGSFVPLGELTEEHIDKTYNINVKGVIFTVQQALPILNDNATIVINGSIAAIKGMPAFSIYSSTKAAVRNLVRGWIIDLKGKGNIRINVVSPGPILTPAIDGLGNSDAERAQIKESLKSQVPLGRMGDPDEIAKAVVFLSSDDSSFVQGVELFVDGGMAQV